MTERLGVGGMLVQNRRTVRLRKRKKRQKSRKKGKAK